MYQLGKEWRQNVTARQERVKVLKAEIIKHKQEEASYLNEKKTAAKKSSYNLDELMDCRFQSKTGTFFIVTLV